MAKIKYDVKDQEGAQDWELPPVGVYKVKLTKVEANQPKGKDPRLEIVARIEGGNFMQMYEYITFTDASRWRLRQFTDSLGLPPKGEIDDSKLVGRIALVKVKHENNLDGEPRPRVAVWLPPSDDEGEEEEEDGEYGSGDNSEPTLDSLAALADEDGDEDAQATLTEMAEGLGIDADDFETWSDLVEAIDGASSIDDDDESDYEESESEEDDADDDESETWAEELARLGGEADDDDEAAQARLSEVAGEHELDPDDFATWAELADALIEASPDDEDEEESDSEAEYASMSLPDLKKEAKDRGLAATGTKAEIIERLEEFDAEDPFKE